MEILILIVQGRDMNDSRGSSTVGQIFWGVVATVLASLVVAAILKDARFSQCDWFGLEKHFDFLACESPKPDGEPARPDWSTGVDAGRSGRFGDTLNVDGLEIWVGGENFAPGCGGNLGYQIPLRNTTDQPILLTLGYGNLQLRGARRTANTKSRRGTAPADCRYRLDSIDSVGPGETISLSALSRIQLAGETQLSFSIERTGGRLDGLTWRLDLPR